MTFIAILHIIAAILLIFLVLVQDSKGAMGGSFGGGGGSSNSILGPTGAPNFLFKMTRYIVVGFALTSLLLTKLSAEKSGSALDNLPTASAPVAPAAPTTTTTPEQAPVAPVETQKAPETK